MMSGIYLHPDAGSELSWQPVVIPKKITFPGMKRKLNKNNTAVNSLLGRTQLSMERTRVCVCV